MQDNRSDLFDTMSEELFGDLDKRTQDRSAIKDFYSDQTIFITGATGFLGTLLVEKLLRCCPCIRKIIILIRARGSQSVDERIRDFFSEQIFDQVRLENRNYAEKVDMVCGQLDAPDLGVSDTDLERLISETSIIFHVAATVRFDEHIRVAYNINVRGTQTLLDLAKRMPKLKSFVHVSTAYCNCDQKFIDEIFYPPLFKAEQLSTLIDSASQVELILLNEHVLGEKPNTYTLTKATAEDLVRQTVGDLPICVFRPSIVFPTLEEPMKLWMKGFNGVLAISLAGGTGLLRVFPVDPNVCMDFVPADRLINALTGLAWYHTTPEALSRRVYNFVSYNDNRLLMRDYLRTTHNLLTETEESFSGVLWKNSLFLTDNFRLFQFLFYIYHFVPAMVFSLLEKVKRRKPQVMRFYRKVFTLSRTFRYFSLSEWSFSSGNMHALERAMSAEDRLVFNASMSDFQWENMFEGIHRSITLYFLKEHCTKEQYRNRHIHMERADKIMWLIIKGFVVYWILRLLANQINQVIL